MNARDYFPLGVAAGAAFCNRKEETQLLVANLKAGKHTLLMATRRYGKSSLALHALKQSGLPFVEVDFYMATSEAVIEAYILTSVVELIGKALGPVDKLIASIKRYVKTLKPKLDLSAGPVSLELVSDAQSDPASNVKEALLLLERLLAEKNQQAVLLFDEFQTVGVIAQGKGIEAAIRHVAQKTKYLSFIFSGSNRKLLKTMFEDETRPLYKLCWKLVLDRISVAHYTAHMQKAAQAAWKQVLEQPVIDRIIELTERHPYYLNKLCDKLWVYCKNPPTLKEIDKVWLLIVDEEKSDAIKEISQLALGQKNILLQIAKQIDLPLMSREVVLQLKMTSSSMVTALNALEEKDVIEKQKQGYQIINPVIKFYVLKGAGLVL